VKRESERLSLASSEEALKGLQKLNAETRQSSFSSEEASSAAAGTSPPDEEESDQHAHQSNNRIGHFIHSRKKNLCVCVCVCVCLFLFLSHSLSLSVSLSIFCFCFFASLNAPLFLLMFKLPLFVRVSSSNKPQQTTESD
jgi:hypothetical protein